MIRKVLFLGVLGFVAALSVSSARADIILVAELSGRQEVPGNNSQAYGYATFSLNDARTALSFSAIVYGIDFTGNQTPGTAADNMVNVHIHAVNATTNPTSTAGAPGTNAGVAWGFIGMPFHDNNPTNTVVTPFTSGVGGTVTGVWDLNEGAAGSLTPYLPNILAGRSYINFHTVGIPSGEIRGQISHAPEPATLLLFGLGGLGLASTRLVRRFRKS